MSVSRLYLAAAGSGKTTFLIEELGKNPRRTIYTTYTEENASAAKEMLYKAAAGGGLVQTWFSFLLEHGVRPFQGTAGFHSVRFGGIHISPEGANYNPRPTARYFSDNAGNVYSSKISELVLYCDKTSNGAVIRRIKSMFDRVLIDEAQDLAGYDYDLIHEMMRQGIEVVLCGDRRQMTYRTNKGRKYNGLDILQYFEKHDSAGLCHIDFTTLNGSFRCPQSILDVAIRLYPKLPPTKSLCPSSDQGHVGVYIVPRSKVDAYCREYNPVVLRNGRNVATPACCRAVNFGLSKGLTLERTLIYPVKPVERWLVDDGKDLKDETRSKFYVALTRARHSAGIVLPDKTALSLSGEYPVWSYKE